MTQTCEQVDEDDEKYKSANVMRSTAETTKKIDNGNDPDELRPAQVGVKVLFGKHPFTFMQYALLKVEMMIRFDIFQQQDFEEFTSKTYLMNAEEMWEEWLESPNNEAFKTHFDSTPQGAQDALKDAVLEPFETMDDIISGVPLIQPPSTCLPSLTSAIVAQVAKTAMAGNSRTVTRESS